LLGLPLRELSLFFGYRRRVSSRAGKWREEAMLRSLKEGSGQQTERPIAKEVIVGCESDGILIFGSVYD
jgi:hypothetical protein